MAFNGQQNDILAYMWRIFLNTFLIKYSKFNKT